MAPAPPTLLGLTSQSSSLMVGGNNDCSNDGHDEIPMNMHSP